MLSSSPKIDRSPPDGYQPGYILRYPILVLNIAAIAMLFVIAPLLGGVMWRAGIAALVPEFLLSPLDSAGLLAVTVMTTVIHELIHGSVLRYYGYRVTYGVSLRLLVAYAAAFGQFQQRRHALVNALAPLVSITAVMAPLLLISNQYAVAAACIALVTNITGAVGDIYVTWRLLQLPRRTLLYDVDPGQMLIFLPVSAPSQAGYS